MTTTFVFAALGAKALGLLYLWLLSAIIAAALSRSKGYGEKPGLGTGLLLTALGPIIWLFVPPKDEHAEWHERKPWQRRRKPTESEMSSMSGAQAAGATAMGGGTADPAATTTSGTDAGGSGGSGAGSRPGESRG